MDTQNKRRPNYKKGVLWGLSIGGIGYIIFQVIHFIHAVNMVTEQENQDKFKEAKFFIILVDSIGKKDTMLLSDYNEMNKQKTDSLLKLLK